MCRHPLCARRPWQWRLLKRAAPHHSTLHIRGNTHLPRATSEPRANMWLKLDDASSAASLYGTIEGHARASPDERAMAMRKLALAREGLADPLSPPAALVLYFYSTIVV